MTVDTVKAICNKNTPDTMASYMTKGQLVQAYELLFGIPVHKNAKSIDLAWSCWQYVQDEIRTADLCKILR